MKVKRLQSVRLDLCRHFNGRVSICEADPLSTNHIIFKARPKVYSYLCTSKFFTDRGWSSQLQLDVPCDVYGQYTYEAYPIEEQVVPTQNLEKHSEEAVSTQDSIKGIKYYDLQVGKIYQIEDGESVYLTKVTFIGTSVFEVLVIDPVKGLLYASQFPFSRAETLTISIPDAKIRKRFSDILYQYKLKGNDLPKVGDGVFEIKF